MTDFHTYWFSVSEDLDKDELADLSKELSEFFGEPIVVCNRDVKPMDKEEVSEFIDELKIAINE